MIAISPAASRVAQPKYFSGIPAPHNSPARTSPRLTTDPKSGSTISRSDSTPKAGSTGTSSDFVVR